ncbi:MAG: glycosyltransferase [Pseudomonadota bacterium]
MNILMISDVYFPRINGVSTSIQTFKNEFEKLGHRVVLIVPAYKEHEEEKNIYRIPSRRIPYDPEDRMMKYKAMVKLASVLEQQKFDLVHIHTPFVAHYAGVKLSKLLNIPCIATYHTLFEEYLYHYIPLVPKQIMRFFTRRFSSSQNDQVQGVIAPSSIIVNLLKEYGVQNKITIIPTGIDSKRFENGDAERFKTKYNIPNNKKILLNVSRVAFEKNMGVLIEMLQQVKKEISDVHLIIAGEGPAKKSYMQLASKLDLDDNISFVGYLDRDTELVDCYHCADLFVFSSKTETQGLVLLEAMAAGTPVISVAEMGTKDVLKDCRAAIITTGEVDDFSSKVISVLSHQGQLDTLKSEAKPYSATWDSTALAKKMLEFYQMIIKSQ